MRLFHGSPYGGLRDFREFIGRKGAPAVFFTEDRHVAEDYARTRPEWSDATHSAFDPGTGGASPTIYEVTIDASPEEILDTRRPEHAEMYQAFRRAMRQDDPDDPASGLLRTPMMEDGSRIRSRASFRMAKLAPCDPSLSQAPTKEGPRNYVEGASRTRYGDAAQFYLVRSDAIEERNARRKKR